METQFLVLFINEHGQRYQRGNPNSNPKSKISPICLTHITLLENNSDTFFQMKKRK